MARSIEKARARAQERTTRFVDVALDLTAERNEITIAGTATLQPSGEQLWQLVAGGVTT